MKCVPLTRVYGPAKSKTFYLFHTYNESRRIEEVSSNLNDEITIAILAKNKAHCLPLYLEQIESQTYPAEKIKLYIRTNNNCDHTAALLESWMEKVKDRYSEIFYDCSDVPEPVHEYAPHEWNTLRLKVLGRLRKESVEWAQEKGTHYFVADCDNFILPETLEALYKTGLPVIGPLLKNGDDPLSLYSDYHHCTDPQGYYKSCQHYYDILFQNVKGPDRGGCDPLHVSHTQAIPAFRDIRRWQRSIRICDLQRYIEKIQHPAVYRQPQDLWQAHFLRYGGGF